MLATEVQEVLQAVRDRTRSSISIAITDIDALVISLACGMFDANALLEYAFSSIVRADAIAAKAKLSLSDAEFVVLFGTPDAASVAARTDQNNRRLSVYEQLSESKLFRQNLEAALSTTLLEDEQRAAWAASPAIRVAAQIALCRTTDAAACLSSVCGGIVRADNRRLDDLKNGIEETGLDVLVVTQAILALASSVV